MSNSIISEKFKLNLFILRKCRENMNYSIEQISEEVPNVVSIEKGEKRPTYDELNILAEIYKVGRWVFFKDQLPIQQDYSRRDEYAEILRNKLIDKLEKDIEYLRNAPKKEIVFFDHNNYEEYHDIELPIEEFVKNNIEK